jgi:hypothetical protein
LGSRFVFRAALAQRKHCYYRRRGASIRQPPDARLEEWNVFARRPLRRCQKVEGGQAEATMHGLIYLIGLIVVIMFILSVLGLR